MNLKYHNTMAAKNTNVSRVSTDSSWIIRYKLKKATWNAKRISCISVHDNDHRMVIDDLVPDAYLHITRKFLSAKLSFIFFPTLSYTRVFLLHYSRENFDTSLLLSRFSTQFFLSVLNLGRRG